MIPLDFFAQFWPGFWANLIAGTMIIGVALWLEATLDEARERRHEARESRRLKK